MLEASLFTNFAVQLGEGAQLSVLIASFEVGTLSTPALRKNFRKIRAVSGLELTISKLLGQPIGARHVTKDHWIWQAETTPASIGKVTLSRLKTGLIVATVMRKVDHEELSDQKIRAEITKIRQELTKFHGLTVNSDNVIYPVLVILSKSKKREWRLPGLHVEVSKESDEFKVELMRQICHRVGIERSLLNWAQTGNSRKWFQIPFWTPYASFRVGNFPVEILADSADVVAKLDSLRAEFNLERVRVSVLARSRTWWTVVSVIVALTIFTIDVALRLARTFE